MNLLQKTAGVLIATSLLGACATTTDRNTAIGAGSGAVLGGVVGAAVSDRGNKNEGAAIGAVVGGVLGAVVGNQYGDRIEQSMRNIFSGSGVNVTRMDDGSLRVNLDSDVSFATGSAQLRTGAYSTLDKVVTVARQYPNSTIGVVGHTDNVGNAASNQTLSVARANSVKDYLITRNISGSRINATGRGSSQPMADNASEAGRAQNRRVEIFVFPK